MVVLLLIELQKVLFALEILLQLVHLLAIHVFIIFFLKTFIFFDLMGNEKLGVGAL